MKNFSLYYAPHALTVILAFILTTACNNSPERTASAQAPPDTLTHPKLPCMWIDDKTSSTDEKYFHDTFNPMLVKQIKHHETDSIFYTSNAFKQMIEYCWKTWNPTIVYLDIYPVVAPPPNADTMTLLFVPKDKNLAPLGYLKVTSGAATFPQPDDIRQIGDFNDWTSRYASRIAGLNKQLDASDPGNYKHCKSTDPTQFSNTIYLHHRYADFVALDTEFSTQHKNYATEVSGVKAFFSARPYVSGQQYSLSNRLYINLELTLDDKPGHHQIYSLQAQDRNRTLQLPCLPLYEPCVVTAPTSTPGGNNGQMCPPTCIP